MRVIITPMSAETNNKVELSPAEPSQIDMTQLAADIKRWGQELGFQQIGITDIDLQGDEQHLLNWLKDDMHGEMEYMQRHGTKRSRPNELVAGTTRVISARMDYLPESREIMGDTMEEKTNAYISRYSLGRDYHKVLRKRLNTLAKKISTVVGNFGYRAFTDSAPVLEKALAQKAGLGWIGKHTNLINQKSGSWFFLGELYTDLPLPTDQQTKNHCGECNDCITVCPTQAIIAPYQVDARRCISYLTIELRGSIPVEFRKAMGNRIYGCDDCQIVCPWNRFASLSEEPDFAPRNNLDSVTLVELFSWSEEEFNKKTEGSAIRRIGYDCWLRNIAVALGNADRNHSVVGALMARREDDSGLVREHVEWALDNLA